MNGTTSPSSGSTDGSWSLRHRLAATAGLVAALVLAGTASVVFFVARAQMIADFDRIWQARGDSVTSALEYQDDKLSLDEQPESLTVFATTSTVAAYQIWVGDTVVARSPSLAGHDLPRTATGTTSSRGAHWMVMPDGRPGRIQSWTFIVEPDQESSSPRAFIAIAAVTDDLNHAISALAWLLVWATVIGSGVSAFLMSVMATRMVRPLDKLSSLLALCTPGSQQAVSLADPPRELVPVITHLNEAFARLESALTREKGFTADAAHELRTPLAALRLLLEVSLSEADPIDARRQDVGDAHTLALRLQRIVDALLALARLDRGLIAPHPEHLDLGVLVEEVWTGVAIAASARGITCRREGLGQLTIITDRDLLRQILVNLCDNAISHGDVDSEVVITAASSTPGGAILTIANEASTAPDLSEAGQRLWRADQAREGAGRHVGIGLSLCQRIATVLQSGLRLERQGSRVMVSLSLSGLDSYGTTPPSASTPA